MENLINEYFEYLYKNDLESDRFKSLPPERQAELVKNAKEQTAATLHKLVKRIQDKDIALFLNATFHPSNKFFRKVFTEITGIVLPSGSRDTQVVIEQFIGKEQLAAHYKQKEQEEQEKENKKKQKELERVESLKEKIKNNVEVSGEELVAVARSIGVEVHPRTTGMLYKRVVGINKDQARISGKGLSDTAWKVYRQVRGAL